MIGRSHRRASFVDVARKLAEVLDMTVVYLVSDSDLLEMLDRRRAAAGVSDADRDRSLFFADDLTWDTRPRKTNGVPEAALGSPSK